MKKKKYFIIITTFIQLILAALSIVNAKAIIDSKMTSVEQLPEAMRDKLISTYQSMGTNYIITFAIICIVACLFVLFFAFRDKLQKRKGLIIFLLVLTIFTESYDIIWLIAVVNIILMATIKREKNKVKKEIPKMEKEIITTKKIVLAIVLLALFFSEDLLSIFITSEALMIFVLVLYYFGMIGLSIWIFKDVFIEGVKAFIKNFGAYSRYIIPKFLIFLVSFGIINIVCMSIVNARATNQELVEQLPTLLLFPLLVIYAPIVEESVFRGGLRRLIANDKLFIVVSAIVFGLIHTVFVETNIVNLFVLAIPYAFMGGFFAYAYVKTNNMMVSISFHALNNLLAAISSVAATIIFIGL